MEFNHREVSMNISVKNLTKVYGRKLALNNVSIEFSPGVYALLGPNGAGKSTFINLMTDSINRTDGEILCNGKEILKLGRHYRQKLGYMPQQQKIYENYTGIEFLKYMASVKGLHGKKTAEQIEHLLHIVNLWDKRFEKTGSYSGGMKQRIMLAQALLGNPEILILDEPTAGLDPYERINIRNYIAALAEKMIVIFATHVVSDIECIAKEVILVKDGSFIKTGSPAELIQGMMDKVGRIHCTFEDINALEKEYCAGNVMQTVDGLWLRVVGDNLDFEKVLREKEPGLEDVYLYYQNFDRQEG
jgi:ABC-type multidrug transport system ATPase subunit